MLGITTGGTCYFSNEVIVGERDMKSIEVGYGDLEKMGIKLVFDSAEAIDGAAKTVKTKGGQTASPRPGSPARVPARPRRERGRRGLPPRAPAPQAPEHPARGRPARLARGRPRARRACLGRLSFRGSRALNTTTPSAI